MVIDKIFQQVNKETINTFLSLVKINGIPIDRSIELIFNDNTTECIIFMDTKNKYYNITYLIDFGRKQLLNSGYKEITIINKDIVYISNKNFPRKMLINGVEREVIGMFNGQYLVSTGNVYHLFDDAEEINIDMNVKELLEFAQYNLGVSINLSI